MPSGVHEDCLSLVKDAIDSIQQGKQGCVSLAIRKLELCAQLLDDKDLQSWCYFQLGGYSNLLQTTDSTDKDLDKYLAKVFKILKEQKIPYSNDELYPRLGSSGGEFQSIEFIESTMARLNREKSGNDGTYYRSNLQRTIAATSNAAYKKLAKLYKNLNFGEIPSRQFNVIRDSVDNLLLDICPDAVEKFMVAYERLSSSSAEDWSHALTAARRVIKSVADSIYPPKETPKGERKLGEEQYINRLWAFLDENAASGSDKDLAKVHIDYLGSFLQKLNNKASKGVHAEVSYKEAVRAVLYTYLTLGDVLEFAKSGFEKIAEREGKLNINKASKAELSNAPGISEQLAKEIIKRRVKKPFQSLDELSEFKGVGPKTIEKMKEQCVAY